MRQNYLGINKNSRFVGEKFVLFWAYNGNKFVLIFVLKMTSC